MSRSSAPPIARNGKRSSSRTAGASPRVSRYSTSSTRKNGSDRLIQNEPVGAGTRDKSPSPPFRGEREGPVAERREGEVGGRRDLVLVGPPHPALSPWPAGGEGKTQGRGEIIASGAQGCDNSAEQWRACHEQRIGRFAGGLWLSRPCLLQCRDVPGCREAARGARSEFPGRARPVQRRAGRAAPGAAVPDHLQDRAGLDILVHPLTDDMVDDHSVYALWLGTPVKLKLDTMQRRGYQAALLPTA